MAKPSDPTRESLAEAIRVKQAPISKWSGDPTGESSTLSEIIGATGGGLEIVANMPNGRVLIREFSKIQKGASESARPRLTAGRELSW